VNQDNYKFCPRCGEPLSQSQSQTQNQPQSQFVVCVNQACRNQLWFSPTPVVAVLCEAHGGIVLAHNKSWPEGILGAVTGFIERCEDPATAAIRETREELGLQITEMTLLGVYNYPEMNQTIIAYHALTKGDIVLGEELDSYKVIPLNKLKPWSFGTGLAVADLLERYKT
jgi:NAD+ diphosphatase